MPVFRLPLILSVFCLLFPVAGWSSATDIQDFPNASIDLQESGPVTSYPVISSTIKKVNGQVTADDEQWLNGSLERKTVSAAQGAQQRAGVSVLP